MRGRSVVVCHGRHVQNTRQSRARRDSGASEPLCACILLESVFGAEAHSGRLCSLPKAQGVVESLDRAVRTDLVPKPDISECAGATACGDSVQRLLPSGHERVERTLLDRGAV